MPIGINRNKTKSKGASSESHDVTMLPASLASTPEGEELAGDAPGRLVDGNHKKMISRRGFLYGAAAVGAAAAVAAGVALTNRQDEDEDEIITLEVPEDRVFTLEDCTEIDPAVAFKLLGDFTLPYGSLVWANEDSVAACLLPTDTPSPLTQMAILDLDTGEYSVPLEASVGAGEGFEIYDVRATSAGMVWTEANIFEGRWRVYSARLDETRTLGTPALLDEGDQSHETPSLAAVGDSAYWQVMPHIENENARTEPFVVKQARFGSSESTTVHKSVGRSTAPLYACSDGVATAPRIGSGARYWELVHVLESTGEADATITLPNGMQPSAVGFGVTGFAFCFDSIYDYGDGISNLGTYTPSTAEGNPEDSTWFRFGRTPFASPAWCGQQWLLVKSTQSVCAIDMQAREYCALDVDDASDDWGDYLATSGVHNTFVTFSHLDSTDSSGTETHKTQVRVWEPCSSEERATLEAEALAAQAAEESVTA